MDITHKGQTYGLCFENDYIDIFLFELEYELEDLRLPFDYEKDEDGKLKIDPKTKGFIPIVNKESMRKLGDFVYSFMKAYFLNQPENKGLDFPFSVATVRGIVWGFTPEQHGEITMQLFKAFIPNLTDGQLKAMDEIAEGGFTVKKKSLGTTSKPVRTAK